MGESRSHLQQYAMQFGTIMGIFWIAKFALFPLGFSTPFLSLLFIVLTFAVPFMGYYMAKMYRDKACGGTIIFSHAFLFCAFCYMYAALLTSVAHYIYFEFIDQGYILEQYTASINALFENISRMETEKKNIMDAIELIQGMSAFDITLQLLSSNIFFSTMLALPTALAVMKRKPQPKQSDIQ